MFVIRVTTSDYLETTDVPATPSKLIAPCQSPSCHRLYETFGLTHTPLCLPSLQRLELSLHRAPSAKVILDPLTFCGSSITGSERPKTSPIIQMFSKVHRIFCNKKAFYNNPIRHCQAHAVPIIDLFGGCCSGLAHRTFMVYMRRHTDED